VSLKKGSHAYSGKHGTDIFTEASISFIENYQGDKPFFVYTSLMTPHDPRSTYAEYTLLYDTALIQLPPNFLPAHPFDNGEMQIRDEVLAPTPRRPGVIREHLRDYYALVSHNDRRIGDIIEALKNAGEYERTLFIFASDNGLALGQHGLLGKQNLYDHSTKVPLVIAGPGIPAGMSSEALIYLNDLFPTICNLIGIPVPASVESESFVHIIEDAGAGHRSFLVSAYRDFQLGIRDERYKLIRYTVNGSERFQLFDLWEDPFEINNRIDDPSLVSVRENLYSLLSANSNVLFPQ
jgi:arylsulfatase A-like enzyme